MTDEYYMKLALKQAQMAFEKDEVPVGAVVVYRDHIIAQTHNLTETLNDVTAHAEMQAITAAANALGGKYLDVCTLYVTVEPCVMCAGAIGWSRGVWRRRPQARLCRFRAQSDAPQDGSGQRRTGR